MIIEIKQSFQEVFYSLKNGILDWIPNEIFELREKFLVSKQNQEINIYIFDIFQFLGLILLKQREQEDGSDTMRPDSLDGFLHYIKQINGGQINDSGLCVITTEFFNELVNDKLLTEESLIEKLHNSYHKTISLYFDGGKPNVTKGLMKQNWINENKLKFVIC
jgi:hypothetical protein